MGNQEKILVDNILITIDPAGLNECPPLAIKQSIIKQTIQLTVYFLDSG